MRVRYVFNPPRPEDQQVVRINKRKRLVQCDFCDCKAVPGFRLEASNSEICNECVTAFAKELPVASQDTASKEPERTT